MDLFTATRAALRRWWVFLPIFLIVAASGLFVTRNPTVTWTSQGFYLALPPSLARGSAPSNPFNGTTAVNALASTLNSPSGAAGVSSAPGSAYSTVVNPKTSQLIITATGRNSEGAVVELASVQREAEVSLAFLQGQLGTPEPSRLRLVPLGDSAGSSDKTTQSVIKPRVLYVAAGVLGGVLVAVMVDSLLTHRARRRTSTESTQASGGPVFPSVESEFWEAPQESAPARNHFDVAPRDVVNDSS